MRKKTRFYYLFNGKASLRYEVYAVYNVYGTIPIAAFWSLGLAETYIDMMNK